MKLSTISSNPSSILNTGSFFLLTLIRSSFSSLDSRGLLYIYIGHYPHTISLLFVCTTTDRATCSLPQLFHFVPLPSSLLHTQTKHSNLSRFHHIRQAPVLFPDMPPDTDCPYPIRILAFFEMIRPYHIVIRI